MGGIFTLKELSPLLHIMIYVCWAEEHVHPCALQWVEAGEMLSLLNVGPN